MATKGRFPRKHARVLSLGQTDDVFFVSHIFCVKVCAAVLAVGDWKYYIHKNKK